MAITAAIASKRDGGELTKEEISRAVSGFVSGQVSEAEMAALLMAIFLRGMGARETADLTMAMVETGEQLDLSAVGGPTADKHSTGGVGDKTTLVVAPLVAALGVRVPKMSGRALGHTGGTIDKLTTIPGLTAELSPDRFLQQVAEVGVAIAAQSDRLAPADRLIYSLRDRTATVESIPLIASSVMSKKLAVGAQGIVLDVKVGSGAFMRDLRQARELAEAMVAIGERAGRRVVALITRMDEPLGRAVGDAAEMVEAIETLAGRGPADLAELCEMLAGHMLAVAGAAPHAEEGRARARAALAEGRGLPTLRAMIAAQGGSATALDDPAALIGKVEERPAYPPGEGYLTAVEARAVGSAVRDLKEAVGPAARAQCGVLLRAKVGDRMEGQPAATVIAPCGASGALAATVERIERALSVGPEAPAPAPRLAGVVGA